MTDHSSALAQPAGQDAIDLAPHLARMRAQAPLVHCITNYVAMSTAANVLLAAGASPAMVHASEEVADLAAVAGALTVNIGTLSEAWLQGMLHAARAAGTAGVPWVLDPVAHFISPFRAAATAQLVELNPTVIRGNASEILALAGAGSSGKGVDAGDGVAAAIPAAQTLAARTGAIVAVTGAEDVVTDGTRTIAVRGGHPLMPQVTALGCALTALTGAYLAGGAAPLEATAAALGHYAAAGEMAGADATVRGPGSFAVAFLDALAAVGPADLEGRATWR